jgi:hypothetical protein
VRICLRSVAAFFFFEETGTSNYRDLVDCLLTRFFARDNSKVKEKRSRRVRGGEGDGGYRQRGQRENER